MSECILLKSGGTDLDFITATAADVVAPKVIINKDGEPVTGTMPNNGAIRATLNCGQSKAIPVGYTTGGTVTVNSLASHTSGTAVANNILSGKTAWVNGSKITGTIPSQGGHHHAWYVGKDCHSSRQICERQYHCSRKLEFSRRQYQKGRLHIWSYRDVGRLYFFTIVLI